jgi:hypothetical protein
MADEKGSSGPPGGKRRRPPTTIDLRATEIASEPATSIEPIDSSPETPQAEPQAAAAGMASEASSEPPPRPAGAPSRAGWRDWLDVTAMNARMSALRGQVADRMNWRLIAAGGAGAAAMLVVFLALWGFGAFNRRDDLTVMLAARLAILELQVRDLGSRPQPAGLDQRALADLAARVGAAEQAMGRLGDFDARLAKAEAAATAPRSAPPDQILIARVTALEAAVRPLADLRQGLDAANAAARDARSRADAAFEAAQKAPAPQAVEVTPDQIDALSARVTALEQAEKAAEQKLAVSVGADRAGRFALVAVQLRGAVERGEPFAQELAAVKPLAGDAAALGALEPFAATGVPRSAALARELSQFTGAMLSATGAPRDGGILDRIQQNAERLVRIRPINETPGDDPATVVARAEVKATHGDLAGAVAELGALPPAVRAPAEGWMKKSQAQIAALAAARSLADNAIAALAKAAP